MGYIYFVLAALTFGIYSETYEEYSFATLAFIACACFATLPLAIGSILGRLYMRLKP